MRGAQYTPDECILCKMKLDLALPERFESRNGCDFTLFFRRRLRCMQQSSTQQTMVIRSTPSKIP
eukprot:6191081-Pleurochrysis_carterae.AAC.1